MFSDSLTALAAATLLVASLSWWSPRWALALLLAGLPFFTHHPSTPLTLGLVVLVAVLQLTYAIHVRPSWTRTGRVIAGQPLLLLCALFAGAAILSMSSLPLIGLWREHAAVSGALPLTAWPERIVSWTRLPETRGEFSITSAVLTLQGALLALIVWRETRASRSTGLLLSGAITLGMVAFIVLGLLEAFGAVSLDAMRGNTNVFVRAGTLQSTSGNPGWFSQYLVYALPYALVVLAGTSSVAPRVVLLTAVTGLTAFALVVCFQRGGWLSGAIVVLYLAGAATILVRASASGRPARQQIGRALALLALVLVMVAGGLSLWVSEAGPEVTPFETGNYLLRLKSIMSADRLPYWTAGSKIAGLHPVLGGGHESFAYRYWMYFERPGGLYNGLSLRVPEGASAHNVFLQTLAGTGVVGLTLLVSIFVVVAWTGVRILRARTTDRQRLVVLLAGCGSLLGIACYGLVQEIFYVHALRLLFFVGVGLVAGVAADELRWPASVSRVLWLTLAASFAAHLAYEYAWPGPERLLSAGGPTGLYGEERGPRDTHFRWSTDWASWPVPAGATSYALQVRSVAPFGQDVEIQPCRGARARVFLSDHAWHSIEGVLEGCAAGGHLQLRAAPAWRPPGDERLLGVMTADVRFR